MLVLFLQSHVSKTNRQKWWYHFTFFLVYLESFIFLSLKGKYAYSPVRAGKASWGKVRVRLSCVLSPTAGRGLVPLWGKTEPEKVAVPKEDIRTGSFPPPTPPPNKTREESGVLRYGGNGNEGLFIRNREWWSNRVGGPRVSWKWWNIRSHLLLWVPRLSLGHRSELQECYLREIFNFWGNLQI